MAFADNTDMLLSFPLFGLPTGIQGIASADNTDVVTTAIEASAVPETTEAQDFMICYFVYCY